MPPSVAPNGGAPIEAADLAPPVDDPVLVCASLPAAPPSAGASLPAREVSATPSPLSEALIQPIPTRTVPFGHFFSQASRMLEIASSDTHASKNDQIFKNITVDPRLTSLHEIP